MSDEPQQPPSEDEVEEKIIKDPIYDIMDDDEAQTAFDRLMKLAEEKQSEPDDTTKDKGNTAT